MRLQPLGVVRGYDCESLESRLLLTSNTAAVELLSTSPAIFVENAGQWVDESVKFVHQGDSANIAMTNRGPVFDLFRDLTPATDSHDRLNNHRVEFNRGETNVERTRFSVEFLDANVVPPLGQDRSSSTFNYFIGDTSTHRSNVKGFEEVVYPSLWPGIDLHTWGQRDSLKYEFHVAPGSDYHQIALRYEGIDQIWIDRKGRLNAELNSGFGTVRDDKPVIYQEIHGQRVTVAGRFELLDDRTYTFELTGEFDPKVPLIIDPDMAWSSYLGGTGDPAMGTGSEWGQGIAIDGSENAWIVGTSTSPGWAGGGFASVFNDPSDAFIAKVNSDGTLAWCSYLGGTGYDDGSGIAIDHTGNVWVTGVAGSEDFPLSSSSPYHGGWDAYVAKLNPAGTLVGSVCLGGTSYDFGSSIAVDSAGNAWITGFTSSPESWTSGGFDNSFNGGNQDAYIARVNAGGTVAWSSFLGGSNDETGLDLAVAEDGNILVVGWTSSEGWTSGSINGSYSKSGAFIAKIKENGTLTWSRWMGGTYDARGIAIEACDIWMTGTTGQPGWVKGGFDTSFNGGTHDTFVARLSGDGTLLWSSYLGGPADDLSDDIAVDGSGNVWVTGVTNSTGWTSGGFDTSFNGGDETMDGNTYVAKINASGSLDWSSYLGGAGGGSGIAIDSAGNAWVTGTTSSSGWASNGFDSTYNGGRLDAYVAKINDSDVPILTVGGETYGVRGQPLSVRPSVNNPGPADLAAGYRYDVDFGDGSKQTVQPKPNNAWGTGFIHAYKNTGKYMVSVSATDMHGITSAVSRYRVSIVALATMPDPAIPGQRSLFVGGTRASDTISFEKAASGQVRLILNGVSQGLFKPAVRIIAYGQEGNDLIQLAPDLATNAIFFGDAGNDTLRGGQGRNALFGNAGNDSLHGLGGRDILVGSSGKDLLQGDDSGDILIGGRTDVETGSYTQISRIHTLLETWNSGASYADRIRQITRRNIGNNASFSTLNVHDDAAVDILTGGTGLDWFFAGVLGTTKDQVQSEAGEMITAIT